MSKPLSCRYTGTIRALLWAALADAEVEAVAEVRREWSRAKALLMVASPTRVGNTSTCSPLLVVKHNSRGVSRFQAGEVFTRSRQGGGGNVQGRGGEGARFRAEGASRFRAGGVLRFRAEGVLRLRAGGVLRFRAGQISRCRAGGFQGSRQGRFRCSRAGGGGGFTVQDL